MSTAVREHLLHNLEADLVGPFNRDPGSTEVLPFSPLRWYLTGFLAPEDAPPVPPEEDDDDAGAGDDEDDSEMGAQENVPKAPKRYPASLGLSVLVPASGDTLSVRLSYAEYAAVPIKAAGDQKGRISSRAAHWQRIPVPPIEHEVRLDGDALRKGWEVAPGIWLEGHLRHADAPGLPAGIRAVSLFAVNRREPGPRLEEQCIFQVALTVRHPEGLVPRPNRRDERSDQEDDQIADLQFRHCLEWAVGHGVSAVALQKDGHAVGACTTWIPRSIVPRVETHEVAGVETGMEALAELGDGPAVEKALLPIVSAYGAFIAEKRGVPLDTDRRGETRDMLMFRAETACKRIESGIRLLAREPGVLDAFRLANRAMAMAARQRSPERYKDGKAPSWRMFQLAFVLLNLCGIEDDGHRDRDIVELIFFPTGGGKTEAYLGVIAFALLLRRLRGVERPDGGLGVTVLLRYTLRLLTLDQLGRAATLICALELLRQKEPAKLGAERFSIGLWVGRSATANTMAQVVEEVRDYKNGRGHSPFPLPGCPWCGAAVTPDSLTVLPNLSAPLRTLVGCADFKCSFAAGRNPDGIPVLFVDEHVYRELPCFLVATVDKFAMLPWRGRTGMLFGKVHSKNGREFFGPMDGAPGKKDTLLPQGLRPPELVVQDELHLISGPLGTMVGLYETGIGELCMREEEGRRRPAKIIASTATVRRAEQQVRALFGRERMQMFPPQGIDDSETFFAKVDRAGPGRLYIGVAAPSRAMKAILIRTYVALLGGAERCFEPDAGKQQVADAYMTLVGYFNSLRELGGMRRLLEDEIYGRCNKDPRDRTPVGYVGDHPWVRSRLIKYEPAELTSREVTASIARTKDVLALPHVHLDHVDVVLASNMISVGVDIDRLGLMVIAGQPKTVSEYIQASSRVGRDSARPGAVVTVFNLFKARDRSHYERFSADHECLYRRVEATSVTPFSAPALDRGLAGLLVAMSRLGAPALTPPGAVRGIGAHKAVAQRAVDLIAQKAANESAGQNAEDAARIGEEVKRQGQNLIDAWEALVQPDSETPIERYSKLEPGSGRSLLYMVLEPDAPEPGLLWSKFKAPTSMRDVEATTHLWKCKVKLKAADESEEGKNGPG